jgi:hypothetical protein
VPVGEGYNIELKLTGDVSTTSTDASDNATTTTKTFLLTSEKNINITRALLYGIRVSSSAVNANGIETVTGTDGGKTDLTTAFDNAEKNSSSEGDNTGDSESGSVTSTQTATVVVTSTVSSGSTFTIPTPTASNDSDAEEDGDGKSETEEGSDSASTTEDNPDKVVVINEIADNATITFEETTTSSGSTGGIGGSGNTSGSGSGNSDSSTTTEPTESTQNVTISLPTTTTETTDAGGTTTNESKAPTVNVEMPNTTVTVESNTGSTVIKEATVSTADNTFVVGAGVTINKLTVNKGNVRIKKGATIKEFFKPEGYNGTLYIIVDDDATAPTGLADGIKAVSPSEFEVAKLADAAAAGGTYKLTKSLTLTKNIDIAKALTLNLNGYVITTGDYAINVKAGSTDTPTVINLGTNGKIIAGKSGAINIAAVAQITTTGGVIEGASPIAVASDGGDLTIGSADNKVVVSDLSLLTSSAVAGKVAGYIKLADDVSTSTFGITGDKSLDVDLNNKKISITQTARSFITLSAAANELKFHDGDIAVTSAASGNDAALEITTGKLYLNKVNYDGGKWHTGIKAQNKDTYVEVTNKSTLKAHYFAMSTNASTDTNGNLVNGCGANIVLEDSDLSSDETGFMNNVPAIITMTNCTFSGNHQGALLRGGTYTIDGCIFTLNAEYSGATDGSYGISGNTTKECHNANDWDSGNKTAFAAIVIGNRDENNYKYVTNVTFTGTKNKGVVTGDYKAQFPAAYIYGVTNYKVTVKGDMTGFKADGYSQNVVTGGNVNDSAAEYSRQGESGKAAGSF